MSFRQPSGRRPRPPQDPMPAGDHHHPGAPPVPSGGLDPLPGRPPSAELPTKTTARRSGPVVRVLDQAPETTVGPKVAMKGELKFERLLRIDGNFEGTLISRGDLIIGKSGTVVGPVENMNEVVCDGKIVGNVSVERLVLRAGATVIGDIAAKRIHVDEGVVLSGRVNIHTAAPQKLDAKGELVGAAKEGKEDADGAADSKEAPAKEGGGEGAAAAAAGGAPAAEAPAADSAPAAAEAAPAAAEAAPAAAPAADADADKSEGKEEAKVES